MKYKVSEAALIGSVLSFSCVIIYAGKINSQQTGFCKGLDVDAMIVKPFHFWFHDGGNYKFFKLVHPGLFHKLNWLNKKGKLPRGCCNFSCRCFLMFYIYIYVNMCVDSAFCMHLLCL